MAVQITPQRKQALTERLEELRSQVAKDREVLVDIRNDDHEPFVNASLETAISDIAFKEGQIAEIEELLRDTEAVGINPEHYTDCVGVGLKVTLSLMRGGVIFDTVVAIVDSIAYNSGPIPVYSVKSPMIQAIMGAKITNEGEEPRSFLAPSGEIGVRIDKIEPAYNC